MFGEVLGSVLAVTVRATGGSSISRSPATSGPGRRGRAARPAARVRRPDRRLPGPRSTDRRPGGALSILLSDVMQDLGQVVIPIFRVGRRGVPLRRSNGWQRRSGRPRSSSGISSGSSGRMYSETRSTCWLAFGDAGTTSVDAFLSKAYESAFAMGSGGAGKAEDPMAGVALDVAEAKQRADAGGHTIETWLDARKEDYRQIVGSELRS